MRAKRLTVELDRQLHAEAKSQAYAEGTTLKQKVIGLLRDWLEKKKRR